ncbi:MAG TPA: RsmE family RNA methyltransferase [Candidatus Polarisedimenticolaceae bacterium]|nr:RsmE family RNA methyltransferase [Candidatus Polarisedimenticolaceae bacterium]
MSSRRWRARHRPLPDTAGATIRLDRDESHHVHRVLRLGRGASLGVFDGLGLEWDGVIDGIDDGIVVVRLVRRLDEVVEPPVELVLFQTVCRNERMEWVIQKTTELGIAAIRPISAERAEARPPTAARVARWRRIALEAAKQCGRRTVPGIEPADALAAPAAGVLPLLFDTGRDCRPLAERLVPLPDGPVWLAVGPESGFSADEHCRHVGEGWLPTGLGPRTLRAETAGIVAAAIVLHLCGDLGRASDAG